MYTDLDVLEKYCIFHIGFTFIALQMICMGYVLRKVDIQFKVSKDVSGLFSQRQALAISKAKRCIEVSKGNSGQLIILLILLRL